MDYTSKTAAEKAARNVTRSTGIPHVAVDVGPNAVRMSGRYYRVEQVYQPVTAAKTGGVK
jgi:hypothetical protein